MNDLPRSWAEIELGEILPLKYGKGLPAKNRVDSGSVPVYGSSGIAGTHNEALTSVSSLIVGRKGSVGAVYYSSDPCWPIDTAYFIEETPSTNLRFFSYLLTSLNLRDLDASTTIPSLRRQDFEALTVAVPPLPEQRRIVAEIEKQFTRLDAAVAALERAQANIKRYRASVLAAACEGRLVPTEAELARQEESPAPRGGEPRVRPVAPSNPLPGEDPNPGEHEVRPYEPADVLLDRILVERRARWEADELAKLHARGKPPKDDKWKSKYKPPAEPDSSELPELPEGWVWATMPQLGELNRGKSKHRPRNDPQLYGGEYPFIQTGDVRHANGYIRSHSQTYSELGLSQSRLWPKGTLCITIAANIAETAILSYPACFPDSIVGFLHLDDPVTVRFCELFMRTAREDLERYAPATAQKNINLQVLSEVAIPLPPFAEQHRIVAEVERRLSVVEEMERAVESDLQRAERLRQAILKRAFEGRLVPQDPNDEPASALLDRIRAERDAGNRSRQRTLPIG